METPDTVPADRPSVSSDAQATAVHVVSNLPVDLPGAPEGVQATPSGAVDGQLHDWSDEDDGEDLDMSELEEDLAELEEELDHGGWDDVHGASLTYYIPPMCTG